MAEALPALLLNATSHEVLAAIVNGRVKVLWRFFCEEFERGQLVVINCVVNHSPVVEIGFVSEDAHLEESQSVIR